MRILWIISGIVPVVALRLNIGNQVTCGWIPSMLESLRTMFHDFQFCVVSLSPIQFDFVEDGVRYISLGLGKLETFVINDRIKTRIKEIVRDFNPQIIHLHGTEYFYGALGDDVYGTCPVVVSLQGVISGCHQHYLGGLSPRELWFERFTMRGLLHHNTTYGEQTRWRTVRSQLEARTMRTQMYFIGRTEWDENWVRYYNPHAIYFHIEENLRPPFYTAERKADQVRKHTIYCGAAAAYPLKGVHWLLRAIAALKADYPAIQLRIAAADYHFRRLGLKEKIKVRAYTIYLRRLVLDLGIEDNIVALPSLSADEVSDELIHAELFVLPSLVENSPNSLGEAMLVGTPSIATFVGGTPTILKDGVEGKLVPSADPAALTGAIRRWFEHPEEALACAERAKKTAILRHNWKNNAEATINVYRKILGGI